MNRSDAKAAFRAMGILAPSRDLIENWLRAATAAERLAEDERRPDVPPTLDTTALDTTAPERGRAVADIPIPGADLNAAIRALEAQGKRTTHQAVLDWIAQHRPAAATVAQQPPAPQASRPEPPTDQKKNGSSKLARFAVPPAGAQRRRKPGRPLTIASWFPAVAETMTDGTRLRTAIAIHGLTLSPNEIRSLYRNKTFKGLYQGARRRYLIENWGRSGRSLRAILGRCI